MRFWIALAVMTYLGGMAAGCAATPERYQLVKQEARLTEGGDVDLRCLRERADLSPFESGQVTLFVQIKKHLGTTDEKPVKQLLKMMAKEPMVEGCVMSLAEDFTSEAISLAKRNGILLLDGESISKLCFQALGRRLTIG